jgi:hypothetical protein
MLGGAASHSQALAYAVACKDLWQRHQDALVYLRMLHHGSWLVSLIEGCQVCEGGRLRHFGYVDRYGRKIPALPPSERVIVQHMKAKEAAQVFAVPLCEETGDWLLHRFIRHQIIVNDVTKTMFLVAIRQTVQQLGGIEPDKLVVNDSGETPLHLAAANKLGTSGTVRALLEAGFRPHRAPADPIRRRIWCSNHSFPAGSTPLHFVVQLGRFAMLCECMDFLAADGTMLPITHVSSAIEQPQIVQTPETADYERETNFPSLNGLLVLMLQSNFYHLVARGEKPFPQFNFEDECN